MEKNNFFFENQLNTCIETLKGLEAFATIKRCWLTVHKVTALAAGREEIKFYT